MKIKALVSIFAMLALIQTSYGQVESVLIRSTLDYNAILITEVDLVFVYDEELANSFPASKSSWYSGKFMYTRNAGDKIDVVNTFIPQGFDSVAPPLPERRSEAIRVFAFAQHDAADTPPYDITAMNEVLIEIDPFGIRVLNQTP